MSLRFISKEGARLIHENSLRILGEVGIKVNHRKMRETLADCGAKVDHKMEIVKFPPDLIKDSLEKVPREVVYGARNPKNDLVVKEGGQVYVRNIGGCEGYVDLKSGKWRKIKAMDLKETIILVDALENIHYCAGISPDDIPHRTRDVYEIELMLENTDKHAHVQPYSKENVEYIIKLLLTFVNKEELKKRPLVSFLNSALSPLRYQESEIDILLAAGKYGIPVELNTMPIAGATGPVTIGGNVLLANAELLAGIAMTQTVNPGAPLMYSPRCMNMDMATGTALSSSIESAVQASIQVQVAKDQYGILTNMFGMGADSLVPDQQSAIERMLNTVLPYLAGANIVGGAGHLEHYYTFSPVQLIIDNETYGMIFKNLSGLYPIDESRLGFDAIKRVGIGGNFLTDEHTLKYFRSEYYVPQLFERRSRAVWQEEGAKDINERAKEKALKILKEHRPNRPENAMIKELRSILAEAEAKIK